MRRFGFAVTSAAVLLLVCSLFAGDPAKPEAKPEGTTANCPVSGKPIDKKFSQSYKGAKLYFCCPKCGPAFRKDSAKYVAKANQQLVVTDQAKQVKCPITGKPLDAEITVKVGETSVAFCCPNCQSKVSDAKGAEQLELVFSDKAFAKGFEVIAKSEKASSSTEKPQAPAIAKEAVDRAMKIQNRHTQRLMTFKGVLGTGIGASGQGQAVIKVFVDAPPKVGEIPADLEGVPVEVTVTGPLTRQAGRHHGKKTAPTAAKTVVRVARFARPVPIGISTGEVEECSAGTIGCRVTKNGNVYALSNNHVFALENLATANAAILQPGRYDTQCSTGTNNVIGSFSEKKLLLFSVGSTNEMDAALALCSLTTLDKKTPTDGYGTPKSTPVAAQLLQKVQKYGRTTGLTKGYVSAINATVKVGYTAGTATFVNQIIVSPIKGSGFIKSGDSGSLLVTDQREPTGLLFAGNGSGTYCIANPIDKVLAEFSVTIDGGP